MLPAAAITVTCFTHFLHCEAEFWEPSAGDTYNIVLEDACLNEALFKLETFLGPALGDPTENPPHLARHLSRDPCRTVFSVVSQTIAASPPLLSVKMADRSPKTGLGGGGGYRRKTMQLKLIVR